MTFKTELYEIVKGAVPKEILNFINLELELLKKVRYIANDVDESNVTFFQDAQCKNSFSFYGALCTETLGLYLQPTIEYITGKTLYPTYTYMRIYYTGSDMPKHKDRPSCEYSATVCISNDPEPWEIYFENLEGEEKAVYLNPGDMIVYKGDTLPHWRNEYKGNRQAQVFVHYVDANGNYKDYIYDHRPFLGFSPNKKTEK